MAMKNPSHPGRLIRADLDDLGVTISQAAEGLGVTRQQLYRVVRGESAVSPDMALRLEKARIGSADHWLRMQINYDLAQVRTRASELKVKPLAPKVA